MDRLYDIDFIIDMLIKLLKHNENKDFVAKTIRYAYLEDYNKIGFKKQIQYVELRVLVNKDDVENLTDFKKLQELENKGHALIVAEHSATDIEESIIEKVSYKELKESLKKYYSLWYNLHFYLIPRRSTFEDEPNIYKRTRLL